MSRSRPARRADPRASAAAFLSFLFPGGGQAYNGQLALASLLAAPMVLVVVLVVLVMVSGPSGRLIGALDARVLVALIVLDLALLGWRLVAIIQAHARRARLGWKAWPTWLTIGLVVVTAAMHVVPAYYAAKAVDTIGTVALEGGGALLDERSGRDVHIPPPSFEPELGLGERITVLLVGIDFAPGRENELTDTMLVASLDPDTGRGAMVSVPRDLYGVPLGDGRVFNAKLNWLMQVANSDPATYPLGGPATLKAAIGALLGRPDPLRRRHRHRGHARRRRRDRRRRHRQRAHDRRSALPRHVRPASAASTWPQARITSTARPRWPSSARGSVPATATSLAPRASSRC